MALGLLDELATSLVPVLLGDGIPFFAKRSGGPILSSAVRAINGDENSGLRGSQ